MRRLEYRFGLMRGLRRGSIGRATGRFSSSGSNVYSTAGCLEHIEHGHEVPGCLDSATGGVDSKTFLVGLSTRLRLSGGVYVVGSWTPRASGFQPGVSLKTLGIEKRLGGHTFQLNVSNSLGA